MASSVSQLDQENMLPSTSEPMPGTTVYYTSTFNNMRQTTLTKQTQIQKPIHAPHHRALNQHKDSHNTNKLLTLATYNTRTIAQPLIGDILRLMSDLKIHIVAQACYLQLQKVKQL